MQNFEDLKVWQKAHRMALSIYQQTVNFPAQEKFGLTNQIRRAAVSIPATWCSPVTCAFGKMAPINRSMANCRRSSGCSPR